MSTAELENQKDRQRDAKSPLEVLIGSLWPSDRLFNCYHAVVHWSLVTLDSLDGTSDSHWHPLIVPGTELRVVGVEALGSRSISDAIDAIAWYQRRGGQVEHYRGQDLTG